MPKVHQWQLTPFNPLDMNERMNERNYTPISKRNSILSFSFCFKIQPLISQHSDIHFLCVFSGVLTNWVIWNWLLKKLKSQNWLFHDSFLFSFIAANEIRSRILQIKGIGVKQKVALHQMSSLGSELSTIIFVYANVIDNMALINRFSQHKLFSWHRNWRETITPPHCPNSNFLYAIRM